jgi:hypothetical protein
VPAAFMIRDGRRVLADQYSGTALTNAASEVRTSKRYAHYRFTDGLWGPKTHTWRKAREKVRPFALPTRQPSAFQADASEPPAPGTQHYDEIVRAEAVAP